MPTLVQALRNNKPIIIGLVVTPLCLYSGIKLKEWRTEQKIEVVKREVESTQQPAAASSTRGSDNQVRLELQDLRNAKSSLVRQESLLVQESDSIDIKLKRLEERDTERAHRK